MGKKYAALVYLLIAVFVAWPVAAGIWYHESQAFWLQYGEPQWAEKRQRAHLGEAVVFGGFVAAMWPVLLPAHYCMSGFAENGVFTQQRPWLAYESKAAR